MHQYNNPKEINDLLVKYKKNINSDSYKEILNVCKTSTQDKIHIFRVNGFTKAFFLVSRYQILAYCLGGALFSFYLMPIKWQKFDEQESDPMLTKKRKKEIDSGRNKIIFGAISLIVTGGLGFRLTLNMGKRLLKNIYWLPKQNKLELNYFSFFGFEKPIIVDP